MLPFFEFEEFDGFLEPNGNESCKICKPLHNFPPLVSLD